MILACFKLPPVIPPLKIIINEIPIAERITE